MFMHTTQHAAELLQKASDEAIVQGLIEAGLVLCAESTRLAKGGTTVRNVKGALRTWSFRVNCNADRQFINRVANTLV